MLLLTQFGFFLSSIIFALMLVLSRLHVRHISRSYEMARWILTLAMLLLATQFLLQMKFHLREQGDDVGALINILFFTPVTNMISYCNIRMACGQKVQRRYLIVCSISEFLILLCLTVGWLLYGSLHMQHAMYTMAFIFLLNMLYFVASPLREIHRMRRFIENETGNDLRSYNTYMFMGTLLLSCVSIFVPFAIHSSIAIVALGPVIFLSLFFYILNFVALGYNIQPVSGIIDARDSIPTTEIEPVKTSVDEQGTRLSDERIKVIGQAIEQWRTNRGFSDADLSCATMALRLGVKRNELAQYITEHYGKTFRVWLSDLRIEEVKHLLIEHFEYSNDTIAQECGFSSRTWMQQKFKASTGMTPSEWRSLNGADVTSSNSK